MQVRTLPRGIAILVVLAAVIAAACAEETPGVHVPESTPSPGATARATSAPGPTPVAGGYELVQAVPAATFERMLGMGTIPGSGEEAVVVTQGGKIYRVPLSGGSPTLFGDVSDRLVNNAHNEEGLLGLAFSPSFPSDKRVYLHYTTGSPGPSVVSRFQVVDGALDPGSEIVLLEVDQPYGNHNGGQIAFGPDGYLYVALGDGGGAGDPHENGQDLSTLLGSILRLDVSGEAYGVPPDNPFVGEPDVRPEIYAYGLRNPWRFSFDRVTGDLWAADVGQNRWEEVERIVAGGNYGWNIMEAFECYESSNCDGGELELPRVSYGHALGCSVTGGHVYRGPSMPELDGWYVYGDYCSGRIWAVNTSGGRSPVLLADTGLPIASFGELADGELLVLAFDSAIYRLQRRP